MSISWFFWWVYQLPPHHLILLLLVCTLVFVQMHRQLQQRAWWRRGLIVLLALWAAAVLWVTVLNRSGGTDGVLFLTPFHSYREYLATGKITPACDLPEKQITDVPAYIESIAAAVGLIRKAVHAQ